MAEIDERAFKAAVESRIQNGWGLQITSEREARMFLKDYLDALPKEEPKDGLRVRVCVAVHEDGTVEWCGDSGMSDEEHRDEWDHPLQIRWIEATVPPWSPQPEPTVEGVEVDG